MDVRLVIMLEASGAGLGGKMPRSRVWTFCRLKRRTVEHPGGLTYLCTGFSWLWALPAPGLALFCLFSRRLLGAAQTILLLRGHIALKPV